MAYEIGEVVKASEDVKDSKLYVKEVMTKKVLKQEGIIVKKYENKGEAIYFVQFEDSSIFWIEEKYLKKP